MRFFFNPSGGSPAFLRSSAVKISGRLARFVRMLRLRMNAGTLRVSISRESGIRSPLYQKKTLLGMVYYSKMNPQEELELAIRAKTDDDAFSQLYNHYLPLIYGFIHKRVGNQAEAEDLTSQTFLKVVSHIKNFDPNEARASFKSWLYRIATNTIIDYYRTHHQTADIENHTDIAEQSASPVEESVHGERREEVLSVIRLLPEKYQSILNLKFFSDLSNVEIATSLRITENNVGVLLHRALKAFQNLYNKTLP